MSLKFIGDFSKDIIVLSCDLSGCVYMSTFHNSLLVFSVVKSCVMRSRLGPTYSLAPLLDFGLSDSNQAYLNVVRKIDKNIYKTIQD